MFIHNEIPWGRGPKSKLGLHFYFLRMYVYYQINLTGILYDVFLIILCVEEVSIGWNSPLTEARWCSKCPWLERFGFWVCRSACVATIPRVAYLWTLPAHSLWDLTRDKNKVSLALEQQGHRPTDWLTDWLNDWVTDWLLQLSWPFLHIDYLLLCYLAVKEHTGKDKLKSHNLGKSVTRLLAVNCTLAAH